MKLTFCGAAGMVTGSNFLLEDLWTSLGAGSAKILVDCGLVQGQWIQEQKNWEPFAYTPSAIDYLVVTHAHIDHIGRIPKLVRDGFNGQIISTEATLALAAPMLEDSARLLKEAAERHGLPALYGEADIEAALGRWKGIEYRKPYDLPESLTLQFCNAGHILGSAMAEFSRGGKKIIFTGDLGDHSALIDPAESVAGAEYLVMESVYGDRTHDESVDRTETLAAAIVQTARQRGTLLIPAFSTERTQDLLFDIGQLLHERKIPPLPVFCDSPLTEKVTRAFRKYPGYFKKSIAGRLEGGEDVFAFPQLTFIETAEQSRHIAAQADAKIIIAGSGMSSGGRVLAHEAEVLPDKNSMLLIVGYQVAGSVGRRLLEGAKSIELEGKRVPVRARIEHIFGYSAHMDSRELLEFAATGAESLQKIFVVMGEPASSAFLAQRIRAQLGLEAIVPSAGESAEIDL